MTMEENKMNKKKPSFKDCVKKKTEEFGNKDDAVQYCKIKFGK